MDSGVRILLERAEHEILTSQLLKKSSEDTKVKEILEIPLDATFYSIIIGQAYYAIFYAAKAYLLSRKVKVPEQGQHSAVYYMFKKFVKNGELDKELLLIYEDARIKAGSLLEILENEEEKRTFYTYKTFPQANKEPAEESINNAEFFVGHIKNIFERISGRESRNEKNSLK